TQPSQTTTSTQQTPSEISSPQLSQPFTPMSTPPQFTPKSYQKQFTPKSTPRSSLPSTTSQVTSRKYSTTRVMAPPAARTPRTSTVKALNTTASTVNGSPTPSNSKHLAQEFERSLILENEIARE